MKNDLEQQLKAISLLDGRNRDKMEDISRYFSEFALIKYRIRVEISYLLFLSKYTKLIRNITSEESTILFKLWKNFSVEDAISVKEFEAKINHDVKAVEYFLQKKFGPTSLKDLIPFIHFGLTSYDINIPAYALMLTEYRKEVLITKLNEVKVKLKDLIISTRDMPMLGRTHGQPALPTTMGKELAVFYKRIRDEEEILSKSGIEAKLTGAIGNFNALQYIAPEIDWINMSNKFIHSLGLIPNTVTTQIIPYDSWLRFFDSIKRLNNILLGLCQDIWWYISFDYFIQKKKESEVGSSTMSHKINPITFENAEGNLGLANSLFEFFVRKLSVSRLQRDLSDSTVKRDFGLAFGFTHLAWDSILSGLSRITPNPQKMKTDLDLHWEIFSEGIQSYLRYKGHENAYELLKEKTRGKTFSKNQMHELIDSLPIKETDKKKLKLNSLEEYLGLARQITERVLKK